MPSLRRRFRGILWSLLGFTLATKLVEWTTEAWFFDSVGQLAVYQRMMATRGALFVLGAAWCALLLALNLRHARRVAAQTRAAPTERLIPLSDKRALDRYRRIWGGALLVLAVFLSGSYCAARWLVVLRLFAAAPSGHSEPIFGLDAGFYLFTLPALTFAWTFVDATLWLALLVVSVFYVYEEVIETGGRRWRVADSGLRHLGALGAALLTWMALGYGLSAWSLLTARGAPPGGFDWTAQSVREPLSPVLMVLALGAARLLWQAARRGDARQAWRVPLWWLAANFALGTLLPLGVRHTYAAAQRTTLEMPLLAARREATARAFGLDRVEPSPQAPASDAALRATAAGLALWPENLLLHYCNVRERRGDYIFTSLHFDAYDVHGEARPVFVAAREHRNSFAGAHDWQAPHGHGVVMIDAQRRTPDGAPLFYRTPAHDVQGVQAAPPAIVFGELPSGFAAWPAAPEASVPSGPLPDLIARRTHPLEPAPFTVLPHSYRGRGGVPMDTPWRRLLLAWRFFDRRLLSATSAPPDSRVAWHRRVTERCAALAPFFLYEEPRPVLNGAGRLFWLVNAFSVADSYPLAEPLGGTRLNYLRHAAVAVVDAYDGTMTFFAADDSDPLLASCRQLFPTLFRPWQDMPAALRRHLPYSALLLGAQSDLWARVLAPEPEEVLRGELWQSAALRRPTRWGLLQTIPLTPQSALLPDGFVTSQLFTRVAPGDKRSDKRGDEALLNGPVAGMLLASVEARSAEFHPMLRQWRPPKDRPLHVPLEALHAPSSLAAAAAGDTLLLAHTALPAQNSTELTMWRQTWLLRGPRHGGGASLEAALADWWLATQANSP